MIIKRNRPPRDTPVRKIIRRARPAVGGPAPRTIVRRGRGVALPPSAPKRPGAVRRVFGWRPSRRFIAVAGAAAALGVVVYSGYWVATSPFFKVSEVQVTGNQRMSASSVVEVADLLGESIFTADLTAAQQRLYAEPLVYAVHVERAWPDTVRIQIEERQQWGTWEQSGVEYIIDREGVVLGVGRAAEGAPVIRSSEPGNRVQGDRVDYQAVDAAAEIYEKLPRQLGTTVSEVAFIHGKGVQVTTANNLTALFGDSSSISYKLAVWAALSAEARAQRITYTTIDLRYGNRPVLQ